MKKRVNIYAPLRRVGGAATWARQLTQSLNENGYDAHDIHSIGGYLLEPLSAPITHSILPFPHPLRGKYILSLVGVYTEEPLIWSRLYPMAIRSADTVVLGSRFLQEKLNIKNAEIIPNGVEKPNWHKQDYQLIDKKPTLGVLTGFSLYEKARGVIDLANIIKKIGADVKLVVGGTPGAFYEPIKAEVEKIGIDCDFLGYIEKDEFFKKIDIFTYYSHQDVLSLALLESMSRGLPTISNPVGGTAEVYSKETDDLLGTTPKKYAETLSALLSSVESRKKYGNLQRESATDHQWQNLVKKWIEVYER